MAKLENKDQIKSIISKYFVEKDFKNFDQVFEDMPNIYKLLREHPDHGDILPEKLTYQEFVYWAKVGLEKAIKGELDRENRASNAEEIFKQLKKQFNSF